MKRLFTPLALAALITLLFVSSAFAHAALDKCQPDIAASVATAPTQVRCWFTEKVEAQPIRLTVTDSKGNRVDNSDAQLDSSDPKQVFVTVKALATDVYRVNWQVTTSGDKATMEGEWYFGVGQVTVPTLAPQTERTVAPPAAPPTATPRETVTDTTRTYVTAGLIILAVAGLGLIVRQMYK